MLAETIQFDFPTESEVRMQGIRQLQMLLDMLELVQIPSLCTSAEEGAGREYALEQARMYSLASLEHVRTVVRSLVQLAQAENEVVAYLLVRDLIEWTAHCCYAVRTMKECRERGNWQRACDVFAPATTTPDFSRPTHAGGTSDIVRSYEAYQEATYGEGHGEGVHSFIDESCSVTGAAWRRHYEFRGTEVRFTGGSRNCSPLPLANWAVADFLDLVTELLQLSGERFVHDQLAVAVSDNSTIALGDGWFSSLPVHDSRPC